MAEEVEFEAEVVDIMAVVVVVDSSLLHLHLHKLPLGVHYVRRLATTPVGVGTIQTDTLDINPLLAILKPMLLKLMPLPQTTTHTQNLKDIPIPLVLTLHPQLHLGILTLGLIVTLLMISTTSPFVTPSIMALQ